MVDIVEVAEEVEKVAKGDVKHLPKGKLHVAELVEKAPKNVNIRKKIC